VNGNTRYRPACSLWPGGTYTRWIPLRSFTVSSSVPPLPRLSQRDNEAGRCQEVSSSFLTYLSFCFSFSARRYAINPARDLGPRIAHAVLPIAGKGSSDWGYAGIPVVGPLIGASLAGLFVHALHF
jgi:glycerol uptake facilitator-like aquaporin